MLQIKAILLITGLSLLVTAPVLAAGPLGGMPAGPLGGIGGIAGALPRLPVSAGSTISNLPQPAVAAPSPVTGVAGFPAAGVSGVTSATGSASTAVTSGLPQLDTHLPVEAAQSVISSVSQSAASTSSGVQAIAVPAIPRDIVGRPIVPALLERDPRGATIVKNEVLAVSPTRVSLGIAQSLNFTVLRDENLGALGLRAVTLKVPPGLGTAAALALLRRSDPSGTYDYGHTYAPMESKIQSAQMDALANQPADDIRIGMIDGGLDRHHSAFLNARIETKSFEGQSQDIPTIHGTEVASLLIGKDRNFCGYLPGAELYAADVFRGSPTGGTATDIALALNWLAEHRVPVTNISLAGPANALLAAAVKSFVSKGFILVAAAGNDGPAAPANYPAAYHGVIGVTSVDSNRKLEIDANLSGAVFAAPGVGIAAATLPNGYASVTGTSFAAPLVAARFAVSLRIPDPELAAEVVASMEKQAASLDGKLLYISMPPAQE